MELRFRAPLMAHFTLFSIFVMVYNQGESKDQTAAERKHEAKELKHALPRTV